MQMTSNNGNGIRLTREDLATVRSYLVDAENKYDTLNTFEYLADLGDPFAKVMFDGMNTESYFDIEFFNYLHESTETGESIENEKKFNKILVDVAKEYINLLEQKLNAANLDEMVLPNINSEEVIFIYQKAFAKNEQPLDTWNLQPIFSSLSAHDRQSFWEKRLNSLGDLRREILHVKKTYLMMTRQYNKANFLQKEKIESWLKIQTHIERFNYIHDDEIEKRRQELLANDPEINGIDRSIRIMMFGIPSRHYRRDPQDSHQIIDDLSVQDRLHDMWFWESAGQIRSPFASPVDWGIRTEAEISQHLTEAYLERPGFTLPNIEGLEVSMVNGTPTLEDIEQLIHTVDLSRTPSTASSQVRPVGTLPPQTTSPTVPQTPNINPTRTTTIARLTTTPSLNNSAQVPIAAPLDHFEVPIDSSSPNVEISSSPSLTNETTPRPGNLRLTWAEWHRAKTILMVTRESRFMTEYLVSKGDRYAKLASGVITGDSFAGAYAVNYLNSEAQANGIELTPQMRSSIEFGMALGYINTLGKRFDGIEGGVILGDIDHEEASIFHEKVFESHGLPKSAWTLDPIFSVMSRHDSEVFWQDTLDAAGDTAKEMRLVVRAYGIMSDALIEMPASQQLVIHNWFRRNFSIRNAVDTGAIAAQRVGGMFSQPEISSNMDRINAVVNETGDPIIDRGSDRLSFWNFPDANNLVQTDWVNRTQQESEQLLTEFYLERPPYIMPDTGLFDVPSINNAPTIESVDRLIDSLSNFEHRTIIMDNAQDMMECRFEIPNSSSFSFGGSSFSMP
ncbi:hypothetical protein RZ760_005785 [Providencia rettgeri]|nr:hypothetical protein [Providencia rettgeri]